MSNKPQSFMDYVQHHERSWGVEEYEGRPNLIDILRAPVSVFWQETPEAERLTITLHDDMSEIEEYMTRLLFRRNGTIPKKRIARIFTGGKATRIKGIRIVFELEDNPSSMPDSDVAAIESVTDNLIASETLEEFQSDFDQDDND